MSVLLCHLCLCVSTPVNVVIVCEYVNLCGCVFMCINACDCVSTCTNVFECVWTCVNVLGCV